MSIEFRDGYYKGKREAVEEWEAERARMIAVLREAREVIATANPGLIYYNELRNRMDAILAEQEEK